MIYRKWSLLTGPTSIFAGIVGAVVVADLLFVQNEFAKITVQMQEFHDHLSSQSYIGFMLPRVQDWLNKTDQKKQEPSTSTK